MSLVSETSWEAHESGNPAPRVLPAPEKPGTEYQSIATHDEMITALREAEKALAIAQEQLTQRDNEIAKLNRYVEQRNTSIIAMGEEADNLRADLAIAHASARTLYKGLQRMRTQRNEARKACELMTEMREQRESRNSLRNYISSLFFSPRLPKIRNL